MIICKSCGTELPDDTKFCTHCGCKFDNSEKKSDEKTQKDEGLVLVSNDNKENNPKKKHNGIILGIVLGIILVGVVILCICLFNHEDDKDASKIDTDKSSFLNEDKVNEDKNKQEEHVNITDILFTTSNEEMIIGKTGIVFSWKNDNAINQLVASIMDEHGNEVYSETKQKIGKGKISYLRWNCEDNNGNLVSEGIYYLRISVGDTYAFSDKIMLYETDKANIIDYDIKYSSGEDFVIGENNVIVSCVLDRDVRKFEINFVDTNSKVVVFRSEYTDVKANTEIECMWNGCISEDNFIGQGEHSVVFRVGDEETAVPVMVYYPDKAAIIETRIESSNEGDFIIGDALLNINCSLDNDVRKLDMVIRNSSDEEVYRTSIKDVKAETTVEMNWDGRDSLGDTVTNGSYYAEFLIGADSYKSDYFSVYAVSDFSGGCGSEKEPYLITDVSDFAKITEHRNRHFIQVADIDFEYGTLKQICDNDKQWFRGSYNGNNKKISNFTASGAMFGYVSGKLCNIVIENASITRKSEDDGWYLAVLAKGNSGVISDCKINGSVVGTSFCGIIAGYNYGTISRCLSKGSIKCVSDKAYSSSGHYAGGLVGINESEGKVVDCESESDVYVESTSRFYGIDKLVCAGGLIGKNDGIVISCISSGDIVAKTYRKNDFIGGITGENIGTIRGCQYIGVSTVNLSYKGNGIIE